MSVDTPQLVNRYPTERTGDLSTLQPNITLDWNVAVDPAQFSNPATLAKLVKLSQKDTNVYVNLTYVSYTANLKRVTLTPSAPLLSGTSYTLEVNNGVVDSVGRQSLNRYVWDFNVATSSVSSVTNLLPLANSVQQVFPTFTWDALSPNTFEFQIADNPEFSSPVVSASITANTYNPTGSFTPGITYYWKVRAVNGSLKGDWSDVYSFYFGQVRVAHPSSRTSWYTDIFGFTALSFKNGLSNQQAYPAIRLTFSRDVSTSITLDDYVTVKKKMVLPRNDDRTTYFDQPVAGTLSLSSTNVITFTPSEPIAKNYRYKIYVAQDLPSVLGDTLTDELNFYFTSEYSPYYVDISAIRSRFLSAESRIPDDLINYYIYQASLQVHGMVISSFAVSLGPVLGPMNYDSVKEYMVRDGIKFDSYSVLKYAEALVTFNLLSSILREELRNIGRERKQGEYSDKLDEDFLKAIQQAKQDAQNEIDEWKQAFGAQDNLLTASVAGNFDPGIWSYEPLVWKDGLRTRSCM